MITSKMSASTKPGFVTTRRSFLKKSAALGAAVGLHASGGLPGFVRVSPRNHRYFELSDGTPFIPIGVNLVDFPREHPEWGLDRMEDWLSHLSANGGNFTRVWLSSEFWDVEHVRSGEYDEEKAIRIDKLLELCRRYHIRAKLTLEHFRRFSGEPAWSSKPIHDRAHGGPASSIADFFDGERSRAQFRRKIRWYADRYGSRPEIFGWELWNEVNCVGGGDYTTWTSLMLAELHKAFPATLAMQSIGSFDRETIREEYRRFSTMEGNDVAQVHRYLDPGASLEICRGPVDLLASDAVRELLAFHPGRPVLLAESGAVESRHSGPFKLYARDHDGIILHDVLFAPFFAGAAGTGQNWHWHDYVAQNNLWSHFGRFAEAVKGLDPITENLQPEMVPHERLRIFALRGRRTFLAWCRDARNTWQTELANGEKADVLSKVHVKTGVAGSATARVYDPWSNHWSDARVSAGRVLLPEFSRSIVIRIES